MKTIKISDATYRAVANAAALPFRSTGQQQPDGSWLVPVEDDTLDRLNRFRLSGESDDDALMRLIRFYQNQRPN